MISLVSMTYMKDKFIKERAVIIRACNVGIRVSQSVE